MRLQILILVLSILAALYEYRRSSPSDVPDCPTEDVTICSHSTGEMKRRRKPVWFRYEIYGDGPACSAGSLGAMSKAMKMVFGPEIGIDGTHCGPLLQDETNAPVGILVVSTRSSKHLCSLVSYCREQDFAKAARGQASKE